MIRTPAFQGQAEKRSEDEDCNGGAKEMGKKTRDEGENVGVCLSFPPGQPSPPPSAADETSALFGSWSPSLPTSAEKA